MSLTVNAVKVPWERSSSRIETAEGLAEAVDLDMTATWSATARSYFGRVTKAHIARAVREAVSPEAAERLPVKKDAMAEVAEQLVAGTGWLPVLLRTAKPKAEPEATEVVEVEDFAADEQPSEAEAPDTEAQDGGDAMAQPTEAETESTEPVPEDEDQPHYAVAAE